MSETRLRLSSNNTLRQKTREPPLLQCWPKSCTGSPRQKVGRQQQDGSCAWSSICQSTMRLPHPRSTVCTPLGDAEDALACHRSCRWKAVFRKMAGVSSFARGNPSVAGDVRGIRRQTTMFRSKALVGRCRTLHPGVGNGLFAIATSIDPQCWHFATGPYPADVFDGVSRKRAEAVPAQSARHDPAPSKPLSRAEGDLGINRQRELIGALPRTRFPAPPMPPRVKADGCLLTLKRGVNT